MNMQRRRTLERELGKIATFLKSTSYPEFGLISDEFADEIVRVTIRSDPSRSGRYDQVAVRAPRESTDFLLQDAVPGAEYHVAIAAVII